MTSFLKNALLIVLTLGFAASSQGLAQAAKSEWWLTEGARIRLISLLTPDGTRLRAGLQIELEKGWKTYWRTPGSSGLPPQITFQASRNVKSATLSFPSPQAFSDGLGTSAGYKDTVTFPIDVELLTTGLPTVLNAEGIIGICAEICVPVQFKVGLTESGRGGSDFSVVAALNSAASSLPGKATNTQTVTSVSMMKGRKRALLIETEVPPLSQKVDLFVEGPASWYLSPAKRLQHNGNQATFELDLTDIPEKSDPNEEELSFTLVVDGVGIEQRMKPSK